MRVDAFTVPAEKPPMPVRHDLIRWSLVATWLLACRADATPSPAEGAEPPAGEPTSEPAPAPAAASAPATPTGTATPTTLATTSPSAEPAVAGDVDADAPMPAAEPPRPQKVLILGDSLAATGFGALLERKLDEHALIECFRKGKSASGLARPDFFDWPGEAKKQIDAKDPDLVVVIMGGNDGQDLTKRPKDKTGKRVSWGDPDAWKTDYRARVDAFLGDIVTDDRKVLWLGLPKMGMRSLEVKLEIIRAIQKEAVDALGDRASYVDTIPFVTDDDGNLIAEARVGKHRKPQQIRAEDRIHFTMSGSEYFADRVYPEVLRVLGIAAAEAKAAGKSGD